MKEEDQSVNREDELVDLDALAYIQAKNKVKILPYNVILGLEAAKGTEARKKQRLNIFTSIY